MRGFALVLIVAAMFAACGSEEKEHAQLATGEWATLPRAGACDSTEQALTVSDLRAKFRGRHPVKVPTPPASAPACEAPTLRVANVGPVNDPDGEFLGIAATVTAGNCSVTVESATFSLNLKSEYGLGTGTESVAVLSGPASLIESARIAAGDPAALPGGAPLADVLTRELRSYPVGAYVLAWSSNEPMLVPAGESRVFGLFATLENAAPATYLFSFGGATVFVGTEEDPRHLNGPWFGLPFRVTEPACEMPQLALSGVVPAVNTFADAARLTGTIYAGNCDVVVEHVQFLFHKRRERTGGTIAPMQSVHFGAASSAAFFAMPDGSESEEVALGDYFNPSRKGTDPDWDGMLVPAGESRTFEVQASLSTDIAPGEYLIEVDAMYGVFPDTGETTEVGGVPAFGQPFSITE